jgi:hypothetical protein
MKVIKLTDAKGQTHNETQWGPNVTHTADGQSAELCNAHWLHAYRDVWIAALCGPGHVRWWMDALAWAADADVGLDNVDKCGCTRVKTLRHVRLPAITTAQRCEIARRVALKVYPLWQQYDPGGVIGRWLRGQSGVLAVASWAQMIGTDLTEGVGASSNAMAAAGMAAAAALQCKDAGPTSASAAELAAQSAAWAAAAIAASGEPLLTWRRLSAIIRGVCGEAKRQTRRGKRGKVTP